MAPDSIEQEKELKEKVRRFLLIPPLAYFFIVSLLPLAPSGWPGESVTLLLALNTLFLTITPLVASFLAAKAYSESGSPTILSLGCGLLALGLSSFLTGYVIRGYGGPNNAITVYNTGFFLCALFNLAASWIGFSGRGRHYMRPERRKLHVLATYGVSALLVCFAALIATEDLAPVFFIPGQGPTLIRQLVLSCAVSAFLVSSFIFMQIHFKTRVSFLYWYSLSLLLVAQGLGVMLFLKDLGSLMNWTGRAFQYAGGVYFLAAIMGAFKEARSKRIPIEKALPMFVGIEELRKAKERTSNIIESIRDNFFVLDREWRFTLVNAEAERQFHKSREELIGRNVWELFPEAVGTACFENYHKAMNERVPTRFQAYYPAHDIWTEVSVSPTDEGIAVYCLDVSDVKRMEEKLKDQLEEIEALYKSAPIGMCVFDKNLRFIRINDLLAQINGIPAEEHIGKTPRDIVPDLAEAAEALAERIFLTGNAELNVEISGTTVSQPEVERYWVEQWLPLKKASGEVVGISVVAEEVTERKRMEKALRESEERFRLAVDLYPSPFIIFDEERRIEFANSCAVKISGYAEQELIGRRDEELFSPQVTDTYLPVLRQAFATGEVQHKEIRIELPSGTFIQEVTYVPLTDAAGGVRKVFGITYDVTERKRMEEELRKAHDELELRVQERTVELARTLTALAESEQRFREVLENSLDVAYRRNLQTDRYDYMSPAIRTVSGYAPEEMFAMSADEAMSLLHPDDLSTVSRCLEECLETDNNQCFLEYRFRHKDGSYRWFSDFIAIVPDSEGHPLYRVGSVRDITERKLIENTESFLAQCGWAASGENFFQSLARYLGESLGMDYVCIDRLEGDRLSARTLAVYFDGKFEDNQTYTLKDTPCGEMMENHICCHPKGVRHRFPNDLALQEMNAESYVGTILWDSKGSSIGLIALIGRKPLSNPRMAESILKLAGARAAGELERKRAKDVLLDYAAKLERINRELEEFAFIAAHDLQEPLRKIRTFESMLTKDYAEALGEQGRDYLMRITKSARRMSDLLRSLLDYSRIASRNEPFETIGLGAIVEDALSALERSISESGARVEVGRLPAVEADAAQLRQLFENLLSNSIKYCKGCEKPLIKISASLAEGTCRILVEDNGIGFEEQYIDRIFKPFQRLHGSNSSFEGTGMGLAICRKIVERHGGSITVRSAPGEGSTFIVTLPARHDSEKGAL